MLAARDTPMLTLKVLMTKEICHFQLCQIMLKWCGASRLIPSPVQHSCFTAA